MSNRKEKRKCSDLRNCGKWREPLCEGEGLKGRLNAKNRTLKKGKTFQVRAKLPSGSAAFGIRYASSRPKIVSVDAKGKVRALKKGKASVTVKLYNGKKAVLKVNVK